MTPDLTPAVDDRIAIAFKEWAGVCRALADGRQTILLRKGGIAEESGAFRPEHSAFWFYPTFVHQAEQGLKPGPRAPEEPRPDGLVEITALARVESVAWLDRLEDCERLDEFHVWTAETVAKRFAYRTPGLWVLGVRLFVRETPWVVPFDPAHAGCKTWVPLDPPPSPSRLSPVLTDAEADSRRVPLARLLDSSSLPTTSLRSGPSSR